MGSSGGGDFEEPPRGPAPPANMIAPQGQSAPFSPHFVNFLGDPSQPSTGLTPDMLAQIAGSNGPPPGAGPPGATGLTSGSDIEMNKMRDQLAALTAQQARQTPERMQQQQQELAWRQNRGGGGSAGGRGGSAGGGGWGGH